MEILKKVTDGVTATVYLAQMNNGRMIEFAESTPNGCARNDKWVLIVSTLYGCPVNCIMCDAGGEYTGKLLEDEIFMQIDYLVNLYFPDKKIKVKKFKIQFSRIGEPAFNENVLAVLEKLPERYEMENLIPSISTVAPAGREQFFERLMKIKNMFYGHGNFQLQFSIHTTDEKQRDKIIPIKKWNFEQISEYGDRFYTEGDRKITLNFALSKDSQISSYILKKYFTPDKYLIKITPVNPTINAVRNKIITAVEKSANEIKHIVDNLIMNGYDVIVSIGDIIENKIGSNCGQYVRRYIMEKDYNGCGYEFWRDE